MLVCVVVFLKLKRENGVLDREVKMNYKYVCQCGFELSFNSQKIIGEIAYRCWTCSICGKRYIQESKLKWSKLEGDFSNRNEINNVICVNCGKKHTETNNVYKFHCQNCGKFL